MRDERAWSFVLHQRALEFIDTLRPAQRRQVRDALLNLVGHPWQQPDAEIRPPNDRPYQVKHADAWRIVYWLDVWVREVCIVRVERR
jgi:mRNA-degrading endonuclease RelE of RelBE toxin-antitoxin system